MTKDIDRVIIVGGGPVGLVSAFWLAHKGIPVHVLEKSETIPEDLRASTWHPATMDLLEEYGVTSGVILKKGSVTPTWQYRYRDEADRVTFRLEVLKGETNHPYRVQCEQVHFVRYLTDEVKKLGNATYWSGAEATEMKQHDDHVELTVNHQGETRTLRGRFLIGADGARSMVRKALGLGFTGKTYDVSTMVAITDYPFHEHFADLSGVAYFWTPGGNFSLLRVPDRWRSGITPKPGQTPEEAMSDDNIEAHFQAIVPRKERYPILARGMYHTHQRVTETFNVGRVLLAGDAAHLNSPNGGLGMNSGVQDAVNLADKIHTVWHGRGDFALFDRYTRQRKAVATDFVHKVSDANHHRMREKDPAKRKEIMAQMREITEDPAKAKAYLMRTSMIDSQRAADAVE